MPYHCRGILYGCSVGHVLANSSKGRTMQEHMLTEQRSTTTKPLSAVGIANPAAGSYIYHVQQIKETIAFLQKQGWQVELKLMQAMGDARRLAREAVAQHIDVVIAVGGDGTINEIIQELAGSETALGVLPNGTVNVWAREVGIPIDIADAGQVLLNGQRQSIDLGKINERYFLLMAGIGLDGEVTHAVEKKRAKWLGAIGYAFMALWLGLGYGGFSTVIQLHGRVIKTNALQVIIGNTQLYAGTMKCTWRAKCNDGLLDICIVRRQNLFRRLLVFLDFLFHRERRRQWVRYEQCTEVKIRTRKPTPVQVDGDAMGYTASGYPATIVRVMPNALKVIVPQEKPEILIDKAE